MKIFTRLDDDGMERRVPTNVIAPHDDYWNDLTDWLQNEGIIMKGEHVVSCELTVRADDVVSVGNIKTERHV